MVDDNAYELLMCYGMEWDPGGWKLEVAAVMVSWGSGSGDGGGWICTFQLLVAMSLRLECSNENDHECQQVVGRYRDAGAVAKEAIDDDQATLSEGSQRRSLCWLA